MADEQKITLNGVEYSVNSLPDSLTFTLRKPVTIGNVSIESLELVEPNAGEYESYSQMVSQGNFAGAMNRLISAVSIRAGSKEMSVLMVKLIGTRDLMDISKYLQSFM